MPENDKMAETSWRAGGNTYYRFSNQSAANTAQSLYSSTLGSTTNFWLDYVTASYSSGSGTVRVKVDHTGGVGAAYTADLGTISADSDGGSYVPSSPLFLGRGELVRVDAPAGGAGNTSQIVIVTHKTG